MHRQLALETQPGYDRTRLNNAQLLGTTTKLKERDQRHRKSLIFLEAFVRDVVAWQKDRPPLFETDQDLDLLVLLLLGEIKEVLEHRQNEGLPGYDFKSEKGEIIDAGFFLAAFATVLQARNGQVDFQDAIARANGQASGSQAIELLQEVAGNISEATLEQDLQYLWTIWVSYIIHMKHPVSPNKVLHEYTFPKNDGNYVRSLLRGNPLFEREMGRRMNREEKIAYFAHYRKATRLIRDFILKYVDASVEHTGLRPEHYEPYRVYIYSFTRFASIGLNPPQALEMLETELYADYGVQRTVSTPQILRANSKLPN